MADTVNGAKLAKCFEIVSAAGKEITALTETLDNLISRKLAQSQLIKITGEKIVSERLDDNGWVYTDVAHSFPIMRPRKGKKKEPDGHFDYQISLWGDGVAIGVPGKMDRARLDIQPAACHAELAGRS